MILMLSRENEQLNASKWPHGRSALGRERYDSLIWILNHTWMDGISGTTLADLLKTDNGHEVPKSRFL